VTLDTTPRFSFAEAVRIAQELFGLECSASLLVSERDQNFALLSGDGQRFVLKIAKSDEDPALLDFQNAALRYLHERVSTVSLQRIVPSLAGTDVTGVCDSVGRAHRVRLVSWLEGDLFADAAPRGPKLLASLGRTLAELDAAFGGFSHAAMNRELHWDLRHVALALRHLPLLTEEQQHIVKRFQAEWEQVRWSELRAGVIHGDPNDHNVLVRNGLVSGIIDFGDMVHSAVVCDLAIAIAYAMLGEPEPLTAAATVTAAYHERHALTAAEIGALFPLVLARLCMTVCYAAYNALAKRGDAYQTIHEVAAWELLRRLQDLPAATVRAAFHDACGTGPRMLAARRRLLGGSLSLSYDQPLNIVRGSMQYLYDEHGRRFLDAYNNVPHVGHCHPHVVQAACAQMAVLNTNTRYLNELVNSYAQRLVATLPGALKVCFFVNSGSEANELALRLARAHTGHQPLIVLDHAYHGNTNTLMDISPYKQQGTGAHSTPPWVRVAELPHLYRGPYRRDDAAAGEKYAQAVAGIVEGLRREGQGLCGFIAESWPSVGGQLELPQGYLPAVYRAVRAAGGVCIADEVQTGYGRLGRHFWGFEAYGVEPDIVVLGKPIGNGHPIGAVVTTPRIAASFDNGLEFFSTFGGNTVSCAIGLAVLEVLRREHLQAHALEVGEHLLHGLHQLLAQHPLIGDVRGAGFFLGVELVRDRGTLEPATEATARIVNHMRAKGVLIGSEGASHNVLKIRPPLPFSREDADLLLHALDEALGAGR
jgi:4-aminobutyrate aminotransferase-like enzyme/Ser/Thr protein kinase RdoA (MazF antagonist)